MSEASSDADYESDLMSVCFWQVHKMENQLKGLSFLAMGIFSTRGDVSGAESSERELSRVVSIYETNCAS